MAMQVAWIVGSALAFGLLSGCEPRGKKSGADEIPTRELTQEETAALMENVLPAVQECYDIERKENPQVKGRTELVIKIDGEGEVVGMIEHRRDPISDSLVKCFNKKTAALKLKVPEGSSGGSLSIDLSWDAQ